jgi:uncharacterized protein YceK
MNNTKSNKKELSAKKPEELLRALKERFEKNMNRQASLCIVAASFMLAGCTTIGTLTEEQTKNKIYSGTIRQVELKCAHATCLDFPFSLVADTALLPVTIPWTIANHCRGDEQNEIHGTPSQRPPPGSGGGRWAD